MLSFIKNLFRSWRSDEHSLERIKAELAWVCEIQRGPVAQERRVEQAQLAKFRKSSETGRWGALRSFLERLQPGDELFEVCSPHTTETLSSYRGLEIRRNGIAVDRFRLVAS